MSPHAPVAFSDDVASFTWADASNNLKAATFWGQEHLGFYFLRQQLALNVSDTSGILMEEPVSAPLQRQRLSHSAPAAARIAVS
jgi:hypothetical protein